MAVMATTAVHLSFAEGVRIGLHCLRTFMLMALETHLWLGGRRHHRITHGMAGMTICAADFIAVMPAGMPGNALIAGMAIHAEFVLDRYGRCGVGTEVDRRRPFCAPSNTGRVIATRAMAGLTLKLPVSERPSRISGDSMLGTEYRERLLIVMTCEAAVGTFAAITCLFIRLCVSHPGHANHHEERGNCRSSWPALGSHLFWFPTSVQRLVELEFVNAMHHFDIRRPAGAMTQLACFNAG